MSTFEVIRGVEGCCLALDDTRIAGPKPWGGGTVIHAWETDREYKAVDTQGRWFQLFGTPERAARTLLESTSECRCCVIRDECGYNLDKCVMYDHDALLEWLEGANE